MLRRSTIDQNPRFGQYGVRLAVVIYVLVLAAVSWFYPRAQWDMVAYTAVAIEGEASSASQLHAASWAAVQARVSEGEFIELTADRPYRVAQYADADAFASVLPFYRIKLLYVELASLLSDFMQPVDALRLISTVSVLAVGLVCLLWVWPSARGADGFIIVPLLALCDLGYLGQYVTPDLFSAAFLLGGALLWMRGAGWIAVVPLLLAILARPDHLVFAGLLMLAAAGLRTAWRPLVALLGLAVPSYFAISHFADHPGWWVHFWFSNVEMVASVEGFEPAFSPAIYMGALIKGAVRSLVTESWWAVLSLQLLALAFIAPSCRTMDRRVLTLIVAAIGAIPAKFLIAPMYETRFYTPYLLIAGLCLIEPTRKAFRARRSGGASDGLPENVRL
ncbi:hypothetical protein [Notoacmeibacter marinus]|uniref:hypothetical protein n=1 Tax=Notoacmeibacter marinus TaxID=1876515 RepID=UPI000DF11BE6|nr:hypothetical protein [Notoacmeibacter marinus]